jgi:hypothetical protein
MKKLLFLLLCTVSMYGQVPADATPLENIQITNNVTDNSATKVVVQNSNGVLNTIAKSSLGTVTSITGTDGITVANGTTTPVIGVSSIAQSKVTGLVSDLGNTVKLTGDQTINGIKNFDNILIKDNFDISVPHSIGQPINTSDAWYIYGASTEVDKGEMVFQVGDNGAPYASNGQRFRFHYNADASGILKSPLIIDYDEIVADANLTAKTFKKTGGASSQFLKADGSVDSSTYAPIASPALTGTPTAPTAIFGNNTTQIATTQYVQSELIFKASLSSPSFNGTPTVPTAIFGNNTTQIASTQYVQSELGFSLPLKANLASPTFTGTVIAPTVIAGTSDTKVATTNFVSTAISNALAGPITSINLTGTPTAPTATIGTNTTQIATTAFVLANTGSAPVQLKDFYSNSGNTNTTETDLLFYSVAANRLNATGEKLISNFAGTFNDVTASSQLKLYFAGTNIADTGALTMSVTGAWVTTISIIRTGTTTARAIVNMSTPGASTAAYTKYTSLTGLSFTGTNLIKITGTAAGATASDGDIVATYGNIIWQPAAL